MHLGIDDNNAVLDVEKMEFDQRPDIELTEQIVALSKEREEIDYVRGHLGRFPNMIEKL